jgi:hypothetical protein
MAKRIYYIERLRLKSACAWGTCKSDPRYPDRLKRNSNGADIIIYIFLGLVTIPQNESAEYVHATEAINLYVRRIVMFLYSLHFVGQNGPTEEHLDPVSAITSTENNNPNLFLAYKTQH